MQVESKLRFSISASADNARNMASNVPSSRHLANRAYTDCQGPYASGNSRHCAPLRTIQSIPLSMFRSSFRGRPRFPVLSGGSSSFMRSHCSFVNSYRFIFLFSHLPTICAIFIFQTRPNVTTANNDIFHCCDLTVARPASLVNVLPLNIWVKITNKNNGRSVVARVTDTCPTAALDLTAGGVAYALNCYNGPITISTP